MHLATYPATKTHLLTLKGTKEGGSSREATPPWRLAFPPYPAVVVLSSHVVSQAEGGRVAGPPLPGSTWHQAPQRPVGGPEGEVRRGREGAKEPAGRAWTLAAG